MGIKKRKKEYSVKSVKLPTRNVSNITIDLRNCDSKNVSRPAIYDVDGRIVKTKIVYDDSTKIDLDSFSNSVHNDFSKRAHYAFYPSREKVDNSISKKEFSRINHLENTKEYIEKYLVDFDRTDELFTEMKKCLAKFDSGFQIQFGRNQIKKITIENFMPFNGKFELKLDSGSYVVSGNNRVGKSSFFDALVFCLYGRTERKFRSEKYINAYAEKTKMVVDVGEVIERDLTEEKSKLKFKGVTSKKGAQEEINDFVGVGYDDFLDIVYVAQNKLDDIVLKSSTKFKRMVSRWFGIDVWDDIHKAYLDEYKTILDDVKWNENLMEENKFDLEKKRKMKSELSELVDGRNSTKIDYDDERYLSLKNLLKQVDVEKPDDPNLKDEIEQCRKSITEIGVVENMKMGFDGTCPIDDKACPRKDDMVLNIDKSSKLDGLKRRLQTLERKQNQYESRLNEYELHEKNVVKYMKECCVDSIDEAEREFDQYKNEMDKKQKMVDDLSEKIGQIESDLRYEDAKKEKYKQAKKEYDKLIDRKVLLDKLLILAGKNGVQYIQLKSLLIEIEYMTNEILSRMKLNFRIKFKFGVEYKSKDGMNSDIVLLVIEDGREQLCSQDSGGGRALIGVAMRIAVARYFGCPFLFFDEVCGQLDDTYSDALSTLLSNIEDFGIKQLFLVSHQEKVRDVFNRYILVEKNGKNSTIRVC